MGDGAICRWVRIIAWLRQTLAWFLLQSFQKTRVQKCIFALAPWVLVGLRSFFFVWNLHARLYKIHMYTSWNRFQVAATYFLPTYKLLHILLSTYQHFVTGVVCRALVTHYNIFVTTLQMVCYTLADHLLHYNKYFLMIVANSVAKDSRLKMYFRFFAFIS